MHFENIGNSVLTTEILVFIRKGRKYLYQLFDDLPKQARCEMKTLQVYKFAFNNDFMFKISCFQLLKIPSLPAE